MDMRQLIAQIDHIENKQILNEDAHYTAAPVDNRPRVSKSNNQTSIYEMLIKEFGYDLDERVTPDGKGGFTGGLTQQPAAPAAAAPAAAAPATGANPWEGKDPAKAAAWAKLSPMVQKKIGMADPTDNIIVGRMAKGEFGGLFGGGAPDANPDGTVKSALPAGMTQAQVDQARNATEPEADPTQPANPMAGNKPTSALPAGMTQAQVDQAQNRTEPEAAGQPVNNTTSGYAGATPAAPGSAAQPAAPAATSAATPQAQQDAQNRSEPSAAGSKEQMASIMNMQKELGINPDGKIGPKTRDAMARKPEIAAKYADELGGAKQFPGGGGGGSAAQPATPAANNSMTPAITAYASRMGLLKNNKPDVAAIKKFQKDNGLKDDGVIGPNTAGAILSAQKPGAGGRGGPTAAQVAPAQGAKKTAPALPGKAAPAGGATGTMGASDPMTGMPYSPMAESVKSQDDAILERIRKALYR